MQIINTTALISINETLFVQLISFLIFLFIINRMMFRPLRKVMNEREDYIDRIQQEISAAGDKVADFEQELEAQKEAVITEAFKSTKVLEASGRTSADEIISSATVEITTMREAALKDVDLKITEARKGLKKESEKLAVGIIEKVLERRLAQ